MSITSQGWIWMEEEAEGAISAADSDIPACIPLPTSATLGIFVSPGHSCGTPVVPSSCISGGTHLADVSVTRVYPLLSHAGTHTITDCSFSLPSIYTKQL